ncbi:MAG: MerR family DNA-binding transcriptional regulator [Arthrobacter sp.]
MSVVGMADATGTGQLWSIGELAQACGVTVRALRHYDEIGLYRIQSFQMLGLSLAEIGRVLEAPDEDATSLRGLLGRSGFSVPLRGTTQGCCAGGIAGKQRGPQRQFALDRGAAGGPHDVPPEGADYVLTLPAPRWHARDGRCRGGGQTISHLCRCCGRVGRYSEAHGDAP